MPEVAEFDANIIDSILCSMVMYAFFTLGPRQLDNYIPSRAAFWAKCESHAFTQMSGELGSFAPSKMACIRQGGLTVCYLKGYDRQGKRTDLALAGMRPIGEGAFGSVVKCKLTSEIHNGDAAVKTIAFSSKQRV